MIDLIGGLERLRLATLEYSSPAPGKRPDTVRWQGDAEALARALREKITGEVRFDDGSRAVYSTDASNYRQVPIGVVVPKTTEDVIATVATARQFGAPILARGGGTSLAGQCCNVAVVLDFSKYLNHIIEINVEERWARVQPGVVLDELRKAANVHGLTFGPDPATHTHNTLGGMIGNNSCGMHSQMAGKVEENIYELEVVLYDGTRLRVAETSLQQLEAYCAQQDRVGEIYRGLRSIRDTYAEKIRAIFPDIPRRVSGFALNELLPESPFNVARALVGTECTCAIVLSAKVKLIPNPTQRVIVAFGFEDVYAAGDAVPQINTFEPIALEGLDERLLDYMRIKHYHTDDIGLLPQGKGWLICEFASDDQQKTIDMAKACQAALSKMALDSKLLVDPDEQKRLLAVREAGLGATAKIPGKPAFHPGWEDSAVPPDKVGDYLRDLRKLYDTYGYDAALYGHFGQGCIHCRVDFRLSDAEGIAQWRKFLVEAAKLVTSYGGSLSGEHGDGQARGELLSIMYGPELVKAFGEFKAIWDPQCMMNPGKVVDANPFDSQLREGPFYRPRDPETTFTFTEDDGSFAKAANRCVGVGNCRRHEGGTMCPSYRATKDEAHSTRGRARLLFEMLEESPLKHGWRSEAVKNALDLCLSCKGCKGECPVNVDMATYKAEFLSHYYQRKLRPVWAYAFGLIPWWAHIGSKIPRLVNALTQTPGISMLIKALAHIAPQRHIPPFAEESFKAWYQRRNVRPNAGKQRIILWADTFNNYFHASTARHALDVLERAGYDVVVPEQNVCCGRPLYDYGMLDLAKLLLRQIMTTLRPDIEAGTPIIGLEPSCVSVFKDELLNLYPNDPDAQRLSSQVFMLADFLAKDANWQAPKLERKATVHGHCHQKSVLGMQAEKTILDRMGMRSRFLDDGCCGMAGAFGFEAGEHYDVSLKVGEVAYLPHMREAKSDEILISNGFSCREQVAQTTDRQVLHLADVIWLAQEAGPTGPSGDNPERAAMPDLHKQVARGKTDALIACGILAAIAIPAWMLSSRRRNV